MASDEAKEPEIQTEILGIDPRSPTTEFTRTPIVVETKVPVKIRNKNLDNARKELLTITPHVSKVVPPKLLESSPISTKSSSKRKSLVGLLETNIDYTETDLDKVAQEKRQSDTVVDEPILQKVAELDINDSKDDVSATSDDDFYEPEPETVLPDLILVNKQATAQETETTVKEFDSKLTNLIYEDDETVVTIPKALKSVQRVRTPLGTRDSNKESRKAVSKLKVSDKPLKEQYAVSKIPVFKEKRLKGRNQQCENTPPRNSLDPVSLRSRKTQWDSDNTLII